MICYIFVTCAMCEIISLNSDPLRWCLLIIFVNLYKPSKFSQGCIFGLSIFSLFLKEMKHSREIGEWITSTVFFLPFSAVGIYTIEFFISPNFKFLIFIFSNIYFSSKVQISQDPVVTAEDPFLRNRYPWHVGGTLFLNKKNLIS